MSIKMTRYDQNVVEKEVNPNLLQDFWLELRCTGPDLFTIYNFNDSEAREIQTGWMPKGKKTSTTELRECVRDLGSLKTFLGKHSKTALAKITKEFDFYEERLDGPHCYCIYCKCKDGIIGVGWRFRDGDLIKAKMMAVFTLYAFGLSNSDYDPILWNVAYRHLPFAMHMDLSIADRVYVKHVL